MNKEELTKKLNLIPLENEGGYFRRTYTSSTNINERAGGNVIYYLETPDSLSLMHVLDHDEIYFYHDGPALEMLLVYENHSEIIKLGNNLDKGEVPQIIVPKGVYQGSHMSNTDKEYTLVSTACIPEYTNDGFRLASYDELKDRCLDKLDLLKLLTNTK